MTELTENIDSYIDRYKSLSVASSRSRRSIAQVADTSNGILMPGKMYTFSYFTPKEPIYDRFPIVIGLGQSKNNRINQTGINLHYMPYNIRKLFVERVADDIKYSVDRILKKYIGKPDLQPPINYFTWDNVKGAYGGSFNLKYCVREYRLDRMLNPRVLGYEKWHLGVVNNEDYFYGSDLRRVQLNYYNI